MNSTTLTKITRLDLEYVARNMRELDRIEIMSGRWSDSIDDFIYSFDVGDNAMGYVASVDGIPVAIFGAIPVSPTFWAPYLFATDRLSEVAYTVAKFIKKSMIPGIAKLGHFRAECRSIDGHVNAHKWLRMLGFKYQVACPLMGKNGETFHLFALCHKGSQTD
jgi:hypothetical protein